MSSSSGSGGGGGDRKGVSTSKMNKRLKRSASSASTGSSSALESPAFLNQNSESSKQSWARPPLDPMNPATDALSMQWIDIDLYNGTPLAKNPKRGERVPGASTGPVPVIRMYGVTEKGNSVTMHIHGFTPYFYVQAPPGFEDSHAAAFRIALDEAVRSSARGLKCPRYILGCSPCIKQSVLGYSDKKHKFLKIYTALPNFVPTARGILQNGFKYPGMSEMRRFVCYESNTPYVLRFMIDRDIVGCNWIELPAGSYSIRDSGPRGNATSLCQIEVDVVFDSIVSHLPEGKWMKQAPFRILSFDIECMGRHGHFPDADQDPVIQIANIVTVQGKNTSFVRNIFMLGGSLPISGAELYNYKDEKTMLVKWSEFLRAADVDIITGYNIANFDIPYLLNRAKALKIFDKFALWGRIRNQQATMRESTFQSSAYGKRNNIRTTIQGRCVFDLITYMRRNHKLSSYSLNAVSAHFLKQQKEDVHHSIISDLQRGDDADRRRLAVYCLKDAYLPQRLMDKLMVMVNYIEMARVTGVPLNFLLERGQQIKVVSMLYRKAKLFDMLVPTLKRGASQGSDAGFEGATVIEPKRGYYDTPIATLDFASLYPSIMMAHNTCYSTLLSNEQAASMPPESFKRSPTGDCFVKTDVKKGILPMILHELLSARKQAKKDMRAATDPMVKAVQNGRQLALKISANSVYGFTGATVGQLPCLAISSSVTAYGRQMIDMTKKAVESTYTVKNGYKADAEVVYGDTDSVMIKFGLEDMAETMDLGVKAAEEITKIFVKPVKLEFEKVYFPYLLMNKKRYAGLYWTKPEKWDKLDAKGIETVRRDNCLMVRRVVETVLHKILIGRSVKGAITYVKQMIQDLLQNKIDISLLVITKSMSKDADSADYKAKQAHVELARRMKKRDPGTAPVVGDRVPYVIVKAAKGMPLYDKSEDPIYVLDNNLPIDTQYYLENQLKKPLMRIMEPITNNASEILHGSHTLKLSKPTPKARKGGIMMFTKKKLTCIGCKTPFSGSSPNQVLCKHCKPKEAQIYSEKLRKVHDLETRFSKLWTQCQRCQGSLHDDVLCTNRDCTIFYMRKTVRKKLEDAHSAVTRFGAASTEW
eukprot:g3523.t1